MNQFFMAYFLQLAPMQALTDVHFMNTFQKHFGGFSEMMAPYIMASNISPIKQSKLEKYFLGLDPGINLVPQLLSNDAEGFLHFANSLFDLGYQKVNWNLGCPYPAVTKKMRGSGLLPYPQKIASILERIIPDLKPALSIKIRLGYFEREEIYPLIDIVNHFQVNEVIVHPRTASQLYEGKADRAFFQSVYNTFSVPVIYNGDILCKQDVFDLETNCPGLKGYMIGRGAFTNPFITQQLQGVEFSEPEKRVKFREFYFDLHHYYLKNSSEASKKLHHIKQLWYYFSQSFFKGDTYLFVLKTINDPEVFCSTVENIFQTGRLKV